MLCRIDQELSVRRVMRGALAALVMAGASCQRDSSAPPPGTPAKTSEQREVELVVEGMHCETCPLTVRTAARAVVGVIEVKVTTAPGRARVRYQPSQTSPAAIAAAITESGYTARLAPP